MINLGIAENLQFESQVELLKILTHPARLAILKLLQDGEQCVCHIEAKLGLRQAYISQQLAVLRESGLIEDRRDGWNVYYRVVEPRIFDVISAVQGIFPGEPIIQYSRKPKPCPCPQCTVKPDPSST